VYEDEKGTVKLRAAKNNTTASFLVEPPIEHLLILAQPCQATTLNAHPHYYHRRDKEFTNDVLGSDAGQSIGRGVEFWQARGAVS